MNDGFKVYQDAHILREIHSLRQHFETSFLREVGVSSHTRRCLSLFSSCPAAIKFMNNFILDNDINIKSPLYSGPCLTHYTSNNNVGNGFGLGWHQDWPSMASSKNSVIVWVSLTPATERSHGLQIIPNSHQSGVFQGNMSDHGYIVEDEQIDETAAIIPDLPDGGVIVFSSFLLHRTYVNPAYTGYKLAFSQRFDDLSDRDWVENNFPSAYSTMVDRDLFCKFC